MSGPVQKLVRGGKVAVLYSPGFGAGWSTWASSEYTREQLIFSPELAAAVADGAPMEARLGIAKRLFPGQYDGGVNQLKVTWLPEGQPFAIEEYDGSESVRLPADGDWVTA